MSYLHIPAVDASDEQEMHLKLALAVGGESVKGT